MTSVRLNLLLESGLSACIKVRAVCAQNKGLMFVHDQDSVCAQIRVQFLVKVRVQVRTQSKIRVRVHCVAQAGSRLRMWSGPSSGRDLV